MFLVLDLHSRHQWGSWKACPIDFNWTCFHITNTVLPCKKCCSKTSWGGVEQGGGIWPGRSNGRWHSILTPPSKQVDPSWVSGSAPTQTWGRANETHWCCCCTDTAIVLPRIKDQTLPYSEETPALALTWCHGWHFGATAALGTVAFRIALPIYSSSSKILEINPGYFIHATHIFLQNWCQIEFYFIFLILKWS